MALEELGHVGADRDDPHSGCAHVVEGLLHQLRGQPLTGVGLVDLRVEEDALPVQVPVLGQTRAPAFDEDFVPVIGVVALDGRGAEESLMVCLP